MSEIKKLIERLCPDGVEYKKLGEICEINRGVRVVRKDLSDEGLYPVFQNSLTPLGYYDKSNYPAGTTFIISAGAAGQIGYSDVDFWAADDCVCLKCPKELSSRYLYHLILHHNNYFLSRVRKASVPRLSRVAIASFEIPVPPVEVQRKIVEYLNNFTELEAGLEAELEARRKQYEYYRNQLLTFDDTRSDVKWMTLGEIGEVCMCKRIMKHQTSDSGEIPFFKIGTFGGTPDSFIDRELYEEYKSKFSYPKKGDILISASGTIGRAVIFDGKDAYFQDSNIVWIDNDESIMYNKYLYYLYSIIDWKTEGGTIKRLYNGNLKATKIAIPPLEEQKRIVSILDRFEALTTDLQSGLPAEIEARRKQYEHYREQLLTFKRISA